VDGSADIDGSTDGDLEGLVDGVIFEDLEDFFFFFKARSNPCRASWASDGATTDKRRTATKQITDFMV
jgi:hypothetical protein